MKLEAVQHTDILNLIDAVEWNKMDKYEAEKGYGSDIATVIKTSLLWPSRCFIVTHNGVLLAVIVITEDTNNMTYFTTSADRPVKQYINFLKCKIDAYVQLYGSIYTEVLRDYKNAIRVLKYIGLKEIRISMIKAVYGKQEENC